MKTLKRLLYESILEAEDATAELKAILKADYPTFVEKLGDNINDPKFRAAIQSLAKNTPIKTSDITPPVADLRPTQNEIDVDKSLKFPLTNAKSAKQCLNGGTVAIAGKQIVTGGGGKFIIDGHHRWSQLYCMNPEAKISALDITNITKPMDGLKATQLGIAGDIGKVPTATVKGRNLLKMGENDIVNYVAKTVTNDVVQVFIASGVVKSNNLFNKAKQKAGVDEGSRDKAAIRIAIGRYIWNNVQKMQQDSQPVPGAPSRNIMPQTDDASNWKQHAPNPQAIKERNRLQEVAGIKKRK